MPRNGITDLLNFELFQWYKNTFFDYNFGTVFVGELASAKSCFNFKVIPYIVGSRLLINLCYEKSGYK